MQMKDFLFVCFYEKDKTKRFFSFQGHPTLWSDSYTKITQRFLQAHFILSKKWDKTEPQRSKLSGTALKAMTWSLLPWITMSHNKTRWYSNSSLAISWKNVLSISLLPLSPICGAEFTTLDKHICLCLGPRSQARQGPSSLKTTEEVGEEDKMPSI